MATESDLSSDGQEQLSEDASKWLRKTQGASDKWETNTQAAIDGDRDNPVDGLNDRYGLSSSDLSGYGDTWETETQQAIDDDRFGDRVSNLDESKWSDAFLGGLN